MSDHTSEVPRKTCSKCGQEFPATTEWFYAHTVKKDGLQSQCKRCASISSGHFPRPKYNTPEGLKRCTQCDEEKPATTEYFRYDPHGRDGLRSSCKACTRAYSQRWHEANAERIKEYNHQYHVAHPETARERYAANPEKMKEVARRYRTAHPDRVKESGRKWRVANPEKVKGNMRRWRAANPERDRQWRIANPEKGRLHTNQRRARKRALPDTLTTADIERMMSYWDGCCAVCGKRVGLWHILAFDHWIPITSPNCPGTIPTNMLPLCHGRKDIPAGESSCNISKGAKDPVQWLTEKFGKRRAKQILARINVYFEWIEEQT